MGRSGCSRRSLQASMGRGIVVALAALTASGCGEDNLAPAGGMVRIAGKPACAGRVVFLPVGGGRPAIGDIDATGHFTLTSGGSEAGAAIASHHIVLKDVRCEGDADGKNYRAMEASRLAVEAGVENAFDIDVDLQNGWLLVAED